MAPMHFATLMGLLLPLTFGVGRTSTKYIKRTNRASWRQRPWEGRPNPNNHPGHFLCDRVVDNHVKERKKSSDTSMVRNKEMLYANIEASSTLLLNTKIMKTLFETVKRNWKDQHLQQCAVPHHISPRRAQNARRTSTPKAGRIHYALEPQKCLLKGQGRTLLNSHKDYIAQRGYNSMYHYGLVSHSDKAMKIQAARVAVGKDWSESEVKQDFSTFRNVNGLVPPEALRVGRVLTTVQGTSRASWRQCQRRHKVQSSVHRTRSIRVSNDSSKSSGHVFTSTKMAREGNDAVSSCTQDKMKNAPRLPKLLATECSTFWIRFPRDRRPANCDKINQAGFFFGKQFIRPSVEEQV